MKKLKEGEKVPPMPLPEWLAIRNKQREQEQANRRRSK